MQNTSSNIINWGNIENIMIHDGVYHSDDCAVVAWARIRRAELGLPAPTVERVRSVPAELPTSTLVADIGGGKYDHHDSQMVKTYPDGTPMAAIGLIIADDKAAFSSEEAYMRFCNGFSKSLESGDNGTIADPIGSYIASTRPNWNESSSMDDRFWEAVAIMEGILSFFRKKAESGEIRPATAAKVAWPSLNEEDREILNKIISMTDRKFGVSNTLYSYLSANPAEAGRWAGYQIARHRSNELAKELVYQAEVLNGVAYLDRYLPIQCFFQRGDVKFVAMPSLRGDYAVISLKRKDQPLFPTKFRGVGSEKDGMIFCHPSGFMASFTSKEVAMTFMNATSF